MVAPNETLSGWVPMELRRGNRQVAWIRLDERGLTDPFFQQTVRRLGTPGSENIRQTNVETMMTVGEDIIPNGFIFHISRCGSTLLANALRAYPGSVVVSEARPISQVLSRILEPAARDGTSQHERLLVGVVRSYGQLNKFPNSSVTFKLTSWNLLHIATFRKLWPHVPCLILIRDPLEVAVSCLKERPGWLRNSQEMAKRASRQLGGTEEEICARMLGLFFEVAVEQCDALCRIVDYHDLSVHVIEEIANWLRVGSSAQAAPANLSSVLSIYSKDSSKHRAFISDAEEKRELASSSLRQAIDRLARPAYEVLLERSLCQNG